MSPWRWAARWGRALVWLVLALGGCAVVVAIVSLGISAAHGRERDRMFISLNKGDVDALARTIYGESRGEELAGMHAVGWVVVNRVRRGAPRFPSTVAGVVKQRHQFTCWSPTDPNAKLCAAVTEADPLFALALYAAAGVLSGEVRDTTGGADHYHADYMKPFPSWAAKMKQTKKIGAHIFYRE